MNYLGFFERPVALKLTLCQLKIHLRLHTSGVVLQGFLSGDVFSLRQILCTIQVMCVCCSRYNVRLSTAHR